MQASGSCRAHSFLHAANVTPRANVQSVGQANAMLYREARKLGQATLKRLVVGALGHYPNPLPREAAGIRQSNRLGYIGIITDNELEVSGQGA